jgi:ferredoxin
MAPAPKLRVDPVACDGIGICSHLAPDLVTVDAWGYPILASAALDRRRRRQAEAAVTACPRRALFVDDPTSHGR